MGLATAGIIYPHVIYPLVLRLVCLVKQPRRARAHESTSAPQVCIVMSAFNEEAVIGTTLTSIASSTYAMDRVRILVGDDGSTDGTLEVIAAFQKQHPTVRLECVSFPRSGKNAVMSALFVRCTEDVIICTDADALWLPHSLHAIVAPLQDDAIGAVVGRSQYESKDVRVVTDDAVTSDVSYRKLEEGVHAMESAIDSTIASHGALYAVRRKYACAVPGHRVADDWINVLRAVSDGRRVEYAHDAVTIELRPNTLGTEVRRTSRTAAGGMATVLYHWRLLLPSAGWFSFFLWSHKVIRWGSPFFVILLLVSLPLVFADPTVFGILFYGQAFLYALALMGHAAARYGQHIPIVSQATYFVAMNWAFLIAWWRTLSQSSIDRWTPEG